MGGGSASQEASSQEAWKQNRTHVITVHTCQNSLSVGCHKSTHGPLDRLAMALGSSAWIRPTDRALSYGLAIPLLRDQIRVSFDQHDGAPRLVTNTVQDLVGCIANVRGDPSTHHARGNYALETARTVDLLWLLANLQPPLLRDPLLDVAFLVLELCRVGFTSIEPCEILIARNSCTRHRRSELSGNAKDERILGSHIRRAESVLHGRQRHLKEAAVAAVAATNQR